jgi:hypothetical protein
MPDRIRDLLAAIDKLIQKSRVMATEQKKIWRELEELRQELAAIRQDDATKRNRP